jgi:hypothetical protein
MNKEKSGNYEHDKMIQYFPKLLDHVSSITSKVTETVNVKLVTVKLVKVYSSSYCCEGLKNE